MCKHHLPSGNGAAVSIAVQEIGREGTVQARTTVVLSRPVGRYGLGVRGAALGAFGAPLDQLQTALDEVFVRLGWCWAAGMVGVGWGVVGMAGDAWGWLVAGCAWWVVGGGCETPQALAISFAHPAAAQPG
eukprot:Skav211968  [mRNA]  locus=scaffold433:345441:348233:- [translate_table: standard]